MHPSLLAGSAAVLVALYWVLARRRPSVAATIDTQAIAALNRAQIALMAPAPAASGPSLQPLPSPDGLLPLPATARERAAFRQRLAEQLGGDSPQRLAAIEAARRWGGRQTLPLLYRGLRDVDPAVVFAAAQAMERFRGRSTARPPLTQALPRNVSRTR
ncbi:HEAT repeat domain-containing protein [Cyanobium sp. FACHB-13342]|uniref:HEAT repeat domain-containing protein n=1 Tax=Cyanobium sp. FACHB-13342 TaxID=2692793 RepID=UPI0016814EED|nr:HEAT repeat domain-containing protein [Cyanobium sp. FACHB-13342]MBD2422370.1 HEAT repeat domain-containing protein [Cyanobium sp. FACHB-13342]